MELAQNDRIFFDPTSHSYLLDGEKLLMGVTSLMAKHNLGADYTGIPEARLKQAAEEGTAIHKEIQDYENGVAVFATELIDEYKTVCRENGLRFIASEYLISDYQTVASAIDIVYAVLNGVFLVDIKTTQDYHRRALEWQVGIYKFLFERLNPTIPVVGCACLWIDKKKRKIKGLIPVNPVTEDEVIALLEAERNGLIYVDENDIPDASIALSDDEVSALADHAGRIAELENTLKLLKAADEEIRGKLLDYMEKNNLDKIAAPGGTFTLKKAYSTTRVDSKLLQKNFPAIYEKCKTTSITKASLTYKSNK